MPGIPIGFCGLYCARCQIYIASTTNNDKLKERLAKKYSREQKQKIKPDNIHCWGCRATNRNCWGKACFFRKCAAEKGIEFCYQCAEFPCGELAEFYARQTGARENLDRICKIGVNSFVAEKSTESK